MIACADVLHLPLADQSVDLVFGSPPYEDARTYGIGFKMNAEQWATWCADGFCECLRVCRGLVAWVVGHGKQRKFRWSAGPALLIAELHKRGVWLRPPEWFHRVGIPGSGGPDWLRQDLEWIVCAQSQPGRLPWSDNMACGHPPKWAPGGAMSHRITDGCRVNQWGHSIGSGATVTRTDGTVRSKGTRPSHKLSTPKIFKASHRQHTKSRADGTDEVQNYTAPVLANPGCLIRCKVGGGMMGHSLAHKNEAPFPVDLAEFFVKSFCPPGGTVLDPFSGSGTTAHAAIAHGRKFIVCDIRPSQCKLTRRRLEGVQLELIA